MTTQSSPELSARERGVDNDPALPAPIAAIDGALEDAHRDRAAAAREVHAAYYDCMLKLWAQSIALLVHGHDHAADTLRHIGDLVAAEGALHVRAVGRSITEPGSGVARSASPLVASAAQNDPEPGPLLHARHATTSERRAVCGHPLADDVPVAWGLSDTTCPACIAWFNARGVR